MRIDINGNACTSTQVFENNSQDTRGVIEQFIARFFLFFNGIV